MQLSLPVRSTPRHYTPVLVDLNCAATILKINPENVIEMVDCGDLVWVWDLASETATRKEYRFDLGELLRHDARLPHSNETLDQVITRVIGRPNEQHLHTGTVADILQSRRQTVHEWLKNGELSGPTMTNHRQLVTRDSLVAFLKRRLEGHAPASYKTIES